MTFAVNLGFAAFRHSKIRRSARKEADNVSLLIFYIKPLKLCFNGIPDLTFERHAVKFVNSLKPSG